MAVVTAQEGNAEHRNITMVDLILLSHRWKQHQMVVATHNHSLTGIISLKVGWGQRASSG